MEWQTMETAPQDGTEILAYCLHESDPYTNDGGRTITEYACACESFSHAQDGIHVITREPEQGEGSWEEGYYTLPGYWALAASAGETPCNPVRWMPLPALPTL